VSIPLPTSGRHPGDRRPGRRRIGIAAAALALAFTAGFQLWPRSHVERRASPPAPTLRDEVLSTLRSSYHRPLPDLPAHGGVQPLLAALHDPYTEYLSPAEYEALQRLEEGRYAGVGIALARARHGLIVTAALPGHPARRAGIKPGDIITSIDGRPLWRIPYPRAVELLRGDVGSRIELRVRRPGAPVPLELTLVRRPIDLPPLVSHTVRRAGGRYVYARVLGFPRHSAARLRLLAERARTLGHRGMVLDLRGNPGGLLSEAVDTVRIFVRRGIIVSTIGLHHPTETFAATGDAVRLPLVVLIDSETASAAEVVAGALARAGRARLVGERTYGKGTVQSVRALANGGALKLTTARFLLRGGATVDGRGVQPHVRVADRPATARDEVVRRALRVLAGR
jgi:carboxyl-terminal processing protease